MSAQYSTPGVYIEELSLLPPSVAEVSTAIPAFVGYTKKGELLPPTRITSLLEYTTLFGGPAEIVVSKENIIDRTKHDKYKLYYQVNMFFRNGGGACYIVSAGKYKEAAEYIVQSELIKGIETLTSEDEPTLLVVPESTSDSYNDMLKHCKGRKDRFAILDAPLKREESGSISPIDDFRSKLTMGLDYGAAYGPDLDTDLRIQEENVIVTIEDDSLLSMNELKGSTDDTKRKRYTTIKESLALQTITLSPSGTIAGVYSRVDRERGVWKAPANVGLLGILGPTIKINGDEQGGLNKDANSGKSINVIRSFPGQGTLVWGARTLDGNSNEWRFINVRRLFIMAEESIQKATQFAVFEPNTASTWLKVKAMIESYLFGLWQRGALAGAKPEQAYYVRVGLNVTMTQQDILNGIMRVDVGMAAVRPAEFIVLSFSHKLQES